MGVTGAVGGGSGEGREPAAWVLWLEGASRWVRALLVAAVMVPVALAAPFAVAPDHPAVRATPVAVLLPAVAQLLRGRGRDRALRGITPDERRRVLRTALTGTPDRTPALDERALHVMLARRADSPRWGRTLLALTVALVVGTFTVAGVRHHPAWFAVGAVELVVVVVLAHPALGWPPAAATARFDAFRTPLRHP